MNVPYKLYGLETSMFSGKIRSYLRFKDIPFVEEAPTLYNFMVTTKRRAGNPVMPMLVAPDGEWISDTSVMIDKLEQQFPAVPVVPETPVQAFAAYLFELWGDEFWVTTALHTRWSHPENYPLWEHEAGLMLPGLPIWLRKWIVGNVARPMFRKYLPPMGVVPENFETIDRWTVAQLDAMDAHFANQPFLLGSRPSLGDFGVFVVTYGHLALDKWSRPNLIDTHPNFDAWLERMNHPKPLTGDFLPDDQIAETLTPLLKGMMADMIPYLQSTLREVKKAIPEYSGDERLPRMLGEVEQPMGVGSNRVIRRTALPYTLWMVQRALDYYRSLSSEQASSVRIWLASIDGEAFLDLDIPRLRRVGLQAAPEKQAA